MKLIRNTSAAALYYLNPTELRLLDSVLKKFPFTDGVPGQISRTGHDPKAAERGRLLHEALAEHRRELTRSARILLAPEKLKPLNKGHLLTLTLEERETLLQILNDVRVGCWRSLGQPETLEPATPTLTDHEFAWYNLMHVAGYFEDCLIHAQPES
jgi:hypothetical protein